MKQEIENLNNIISITVETTSGLVVQFKNLSNIIAMLEARSIQYEDLTPSLEIMKFLQIQMSHSIENLMKQSEVLAKIYTKLSDSL